MLRQWLVLVCVWVLGLGVFSFLLGCHGEINLGPRTFPNSTCQELSQDFPKAEMIKALPASQVSSLRLAWMTDCKAILATWGPKEGPLSLALYKIKEKRWVKMGAFAMTPLSWKSSFQPTPSTDITTFKDVPGLLLFRITDVKKPLALLVWSDGRSVQLPHEKLASRSNSGPLLVYQTQSKDDPRETKGLKNALHDVSFYDVRDGSLHKGPQATSFGRLSWDNRYYSFLKVKEKGQQCDFKLFDTMTKSTRTLLTHVPCEGSAVFSPNSRILVFSGNPLDKLAKLRWFDVNKKSQGVVDVGSGAFVASLSSVFWGSDSFYYLKEGKDGKRSLVEVAVGQVTPEERVFWGTVPEGRSYYFWQSEAYHCAFLIVQILSESPYSSMELWQKDLEASAGPFKIGSIKGGAFWSGPRHLLVGQPRSDAFGLSVWDMEQKTQKIYTFPNKRFLPSPVPLSLFAQGQVREDRFFVKGVLSSGLGTSTASAPSPLDGLILSTGKVERIADHVVTFKAYDGHRIVTAESTSEGVSLWLRWVK